MEFEWLGFIGTGLVVLAYFPQLVHLVRERCSAGLSIGAYSMWATASVFLLIYAINLNDTVFIALQAFKVCATLLIMYFGVK
jgi:uncharacterized protein with PQ loop repeat